MRLSPFLVAFFAATATLGLSNPAKGQSSLQTSTSTDQTGVGTAPAPDPKIATGVSPAPISNVVVETINLPESSNFVAQSTPTPTPSQPSLESDPETPPALTGPPPGTPTPSQETPNQIQIPLTPGTTPSSPSIEVPPERQVPTPAAPATPQPSPTPGDQPTPSPEETQPAPSAQPEPRVLVSEVAVSGAEADLQNEVYRVIRTQAGRTTTKSQLQEDINAIFATGFFSNVRAVPEDTPLGVRVTFVVEPNPVLRSVQVEGAQVLPQQVVDNAFRDQYGSILNLRQFQEGIKQVNKWYQDNGYVLAQVIDTPRVSADGNVILQVAEGVVEDIQVKFLTKEGEETDDQGRPIQGRTRPFIITREFELKPGDVFNRAKVERDLQRVFGLNLFEDVKLSLSPSQEDPRKVNVVVNVAERNTGSVAAGAGISSASGLFGTISYQEQNLGGNNQKLGTEIQVGQRELLFDVNFTDPWIAGDPFRTSYTVNGFRRRSISLIFDGGPNDIRLPNDDRPRVLRLGTGVSFTRPLSKNPYASSEWTASLGLQYQRVSIRDGDGDISPVDERGNNLSFSGSGRDDLLTLQLGAVRDRRNSLIQPTRGSLLRLGVEQSVPIGEGNILLNRLRGSYSYYVPVRFTRFTQGCRNVRPVGTARPAGNARTTDCPQALAFNIQGGTVFGDLPPYEAFSLGGSNSVRGYDEGDLGSGRSFIQATAEYRFPLFSVVGGALFVDAATDLGSGSSVPGDPAGVRGKPGNGFGYGLGVRVQSPLGPIRVDYGINDQGSGRIHFGIGERF